MNGLGVLGRIGELARSGETFALDIDASLGVNATMPA